MISRKKYIYIYVERRINGWQKCVSTCIPSKTLVLRFSRLKKYPIGFGKQNQVYVDLSHSITEILYYDSKPELLQIQRQHLTAGSDMCIFTSSQIGLNIWSSLICETWRLTTVFGIFLQQKNTSHFNSKRKSMIYLWLNLSSSIKKALFCSLKKAKWLFILEGEY